MSETVSKDLHPLEKTLLKWLAEHGSGSDMEAMAGTGMDEGSYRRALQWLLSRNMASIISSSKTVTVELGAVGTVYAEKGITPELALIELVRSGVALLPEIQKNELFDRAQWGSAMGALLKSGVLKKGPDGLALNDPSGGVFPAVWSGVYSVLGEGGTVHLSQLKESVVAEVSSRAPKRGRSRAEFVINETTSSVIEIAPLGTEALEAARGKSTIGILTREILASGEWKNGSFRRYQVDIPPSRIHIGRFHPYALFLDSVRDKLQAMGFQEMKGSLAESEFWNNDALFMPQFHPARDIHDAYYLEDGIKVAPPSRDLGDKVRSAHENGGNTGGRGWEYNFEWERSLKAIMRSQGTALSARTLGSDPDIPGKYFGIAKCFRYDQVDATHLPDFFQVEGIVLGEDINMRHLLGLLKLFATEVAGATEYKFVPAYFPFTEPSVELHVKHPVLGWFEMGGAGLFRREVCEPMGIDVPVIAWGLGLDRMALLALGLSDIRDLLNPDLAKLREMRSTPEKLLGGGDNA
ncbi:MAG: phenylalanine--tRNA ligase subunit alpha [Candidatus Sabulitectum sp.]|nr:phenylalanine--tRNA ligase subunit alpha [Candidatus Sabulitectum sp.]